MTVRWGSFDGKPIVFLIKLWSHHISDTTRSNSVFGNKKTLTDSINAFFLFYSIIRVLGAIPLLHNKINVRRLKYTNLKVNFHK